MTARGYEPETVGNQRRHYGTIGATANHLVHINTPTTTAIIRDSATDVETLRADHPALAAHMRVRVPQGREKSHSMERTALRLPKRVGRPEPNARYARIRGNIAATRAND